MKITQAPSDSRTTGSTLWLSSQILSCYLQTHYKRQTSFRRPLALEVGAGVGLTSLILEQLGWNVLSTDIEPPLNTVLRPNIERNSTGNIQVERLDVTQARSTLSARIQEVIQSNPRTSASEIELIVSADTVYETAMVEGLLDTIATFLQKSKKCHALLALERRDPLQIDTALHSARIEHNLHLRQIPHRRIRKAIGTHFVTPWPLEEWSDVEIWHISLNECVIELGGDRAEGHHRTM